jgi:hypothetical protein
MDGDEGSPTRLMETSTGETGRAGCSSGKPVMANTRTLASQWSHPYPAPLNPGPVLLVRDRCSFEGGVQTLRERCEPIICPRRQGWHL